MNDDTTKQISIKIASGESLSEAFDIEDYREIALILPIMTSANLTFQASKELAGLYFNVYDDAGTEVAFNTATGNRTVIVGTVTKSSLRACRFLKIRTGTSSSPVAQGADREIIVLLKK